MITRQEDILTKLGLSYGTDKADPHYFTSFYDRHLRDERGSVANFLEIGIANGSSLKMWKDYFPNADIYGIDINKASLFSEDRIHTFLIAQEDTEALEKEFSSIQFDVILDDGGHNPKSQIDGFLHMKDFVKPGGAYIVEDLHTSYISHGASGEPQVNADKYFRELDLEEHNLQSIEFYSNLDKTANVECITSLIRFKNN